VKKQFLLVAGLALAGLSAPAFADGMGYIRGEVGRSDVEVRFDGVSGNEKDTAFGVRGGYWFNANFAVEGFYSQYYSTTVNDGFDSYDIKLHGVGIGVVAKKNFGGAHTGFFIGGRAGVNRGVATVESGGAVEGAEASSARPYFGINAGYDFNPNFGLSVNYDRLKAGEEGVDLTADVLTLGLEARF
jgi:hypothetical protein